VFVQRVVPPSSRRESWTVIGRDGKPIEPVERYLAYLTDVERSPNTVKAYAHDLKDWFVFLERRGLDWREVRLEDAGEFVAWLRLPPAGRDGRVVVLPSAQGHCGDATVNRKLSAVSAFYQHQARNGIELGDLLRTWQPAGRSRHRVAAVPASHQQDQTTSTANHSDEGSAQAPADPDAAGGPGDPGRL
jgi:site-specific recombinase XerD